MDGRDVPWGQDTGNWNVISDGSTEYCLGLNVSKADAEKWALIYKERYEGKPYPNGKGWYPFKNFRAVCVDN